MDALAAGNPPDFAYGVMLAQYVPKWALEDRLVDLTDTIGHFSSMFDPAQLDRATLLNASTGHKALYGLPMGHVTNHLFVWKSLLEQAGFTLENIPAASPFPRDLQGRQPRCHCQGLRPFSGGGGLADALPQLF